MEIKPNEVKSVKTLGTLNGDEVKLVTLAGGFNIAVGKKSKSSKKPEALVAGSHPAIVSFQLEKQFSSEFNPALQKSEGGVLEKVENYSELIPQALSNKGIDLYVLSKDHKVDFVFTQFGVNLGFCQTSIEGDSLKIHDTFLNEKHSEEIKKSLGEAIVKKSKQLNLKLK